MAYTQTLTASETLYGPFLVRKALLEHKQNAWQQGTILTDDFIAELESFAERNTIHIPVSKGKHRKEICPQCLKAFMIESANKHALSEDAKSLLLELFRDENAGHNGYYLDNGEVKPVQTD